MADQSIGPRMGLPVPISPAAHAVLDYAVAATFFSVGAWLMRRHRAAAASLAFVNGVMVTGMSMLTDYPGGVIRVLPFRAHRVGDVLQAAFAGLGPALFRFAGDEEAKFFYAQAASEVAVIAATNWDAARPRPAHASSRKSAAVRS